MRKSRILLFLSCICLILGLVATADTALAGKKKKAKQDKMKAEEVLKAKKHEEAMKAEEARKAEKAVAEAPANQDDSSGPQPSISIAEKSYDAGKLKQGEELTHEFVIKNTGAAELKILKAKAG